MSMTISASNYWNVAHQSSKTDSAEKQSPKDTSPEVGKTRQSAVSASLDQVNMGEDGIAISEISRQQGTSDTQKRSASPRMDTVEISAEGLAASAALQEQQDEISETSTVAQYEADDLSKYTNTELKQLYYQGKITLQEYEDETGETL